MKSDIELSYNAKLHDIKEIAKKLNINSNYIEQYGNYKAKINLKIFDELKNKPLGKLVLVTSINPTPYGEGKTTMSIGLNDAIVKLGKKSMVVLREPSLGPVFGIKGGATGGGYVQVAPMEDINLHFTGDMHAITSANNLLCAAIDNHIFQGNELNIDEVVIKRCMDINDRSLREIEIGLSDKEKIGRKDGFIITVASEIMAILCLSENLKDLKNKINNILIGYNQAKDPIFVKDLGCADAMTILLKEAIKPNLVQTLENNPALIHGGPFANIAHGCNSIIATKLGLKLADYVVTEAGFGADLGAEKFFDIKCRMANLKPDAVVINCTIRSIKHNGGCPKEELEISNLSYLEKGICNLEVHIENMKKFCNNIVVCLNSFFKDSEEETSYIENYCNKKGYPVAVSKAYSLGGQGSIELAKKVIEICDKPTNINFMYELSLPIREKIKSLATNIYHASEVKYSSLALEAIAKIEKLGKDKLPICVAKTQYSISDDSKLLGYPKGYTINVRDVKLSSGAGFIVIIMGNIMTMPALSKTPSLLTMQINEEGIIKGLF